MIIKLNKIILTMLFSLSLFACNSENDSVTISYLNGQIITEITDAEKIQTLQTNWAKRQHIKVKMMPSFTLKITVVEDSESTEWLYSNLGYAMIKSDEQQLIYRVNLPQLNQLSP